MPWVVIPKMNAPIAAPTAEPNPPVSRHPPMTAAMMYRNSLPMPSPDCTVLNENSRFMPANQARVDTVMNRPIFTRRTGTPTARALVAAPPAEKIQLPIRVRSSTHVAMATNSSHHSTEMRIEVPPPPGLPQGHVPPRPGRARKDHHRRLHRGGGSRCRPYHARRHRPARRRRRRERPIRRRPTRQPRPQRRGRTRRAVRRGIRRQHLVQPHPHPPSPPSASNPWTRHDMPYRPWSNDWTETVPPDATSY